MFSKSELLSIDTSYFNIFQLGCYSVCIQSVNTLHYWQICHEEFPTFKHCKVYHKHKSHQPYHRHSDKKSLKATVEMIQSHDAFVLNGRRPIKHTYTVV